MPWDRADHDDLVALLERYDGAIFDGPSKIGPGIDRLFGLETFAKGIRRRGSGSVARMAPKRILASRLRCAASRRFGSRSFMTLAAMPLRRTSWRRSEPISIDMATRTGSFRAISPTSLSHSRRRTSTTPIRRSWRSHVSSPWSCTGCWRTEPSGIRAHRPGRRMVHEPKLDELLGSRALDRAIPRPPPQPSATLPRSHQRRRSAFYPTHRTRDARP
jgi:hypothetical protein